MKNFHFTTPEMWPATICDPYLIKMAKVDVITIWWCVLQWDMIAGIKEEGESSGCCVRNTLAVSMSHQTM